jgi:flagellar motor protein MotB
MSTSRRKPRISARTLASTALLAGLLGVASCSDVIDDISGYIEDDAANDRAIEQGESGGEFPKLSDVPEAPRPASSAEEIAQISEGLVADRDEARYTNETLRSRYAEDEPIVSESSAPQRTAEPAPEPAPQQQAVEREALEQPAELAEERRVAASESVVARSSSSLAEERRVGGTVEPASEAVLAERRLVDERRVEGSGERPATSYSDDPLAESRRVDSARPAQQAEAAPTGGLRESRVAAQRQGPAGDGVMSIGQFRDMFNERFDSSGRSPYRAGEQQQAAAQVSGDGMARDRALSPGSAHMVEAQQDAAPPPPLSMAETGGDSGRAAVSFQAASIPFADGSASLSASDRAALEKVVKLHRKFGGTVRVVGHASQRTRDMNAGNRQLINFELSLDRATAVSMELTRLGVPAEAVTVMARSDAEPVAYEYMPEGEAYNRRADVYLEY